MNCPAAVETHSSLNATALSSDPCVCCVLPAHLSLLRLKVIAVCCVGGGARLDGRG